MAKEDNNALTRVPAESDESKTESVTDRGAGGG